MTCLTCGASLDATSTTCSACGEPVPGRGTSDATAAHVAANAPAPAVGQPAYGPPAHGPAYGPTHGPGYGQTYGPGYGQTGGAGYGPPPAPNPGWGAQPHPSGVSSEARGWAIAAHLGGLGAALMTAATLGFLGPLIIWLVKRDDEPFVDHHAKEALNFQLTVLLALFLSVLLAIPALVVGVVTLGLGLVALALLAAAAAVAWFVLPIIGAVKASNGEGYRYPVTIRFVR